MEHPLDNTGSCPQIIISFLDLMVKNVKHGAGNLQNG